MARGQHHTNRPLRRSGSSGLYTGLYESQASRVSGVTVNVCLASSETEMCEKYFDASGDVCAAGATAKRTTRRVSATTSATRSSCRTTALAVSKLLLSSSRMLSSVTALVRMSRDDKHLANHK